MNGPLALTQREYELLDALVAAAGAVVSRAELVDRVSRKPKALSSNWIEVHVNRLREKLGVHARLIETVRGAGYRLRQ